MKKKKEEKTPAQILGASGGRATAERRGRAHMSEIGRAGARKRWAKIKKKQYDKKEENKKNST